MAYTPTPSFTPLVTRNPINKHILARSVGPKSGQAANTGCDEADACALIGYGRHVAHARRRHVHARDVVRESDVREAGR